MKVDESSLFWLFVLDKKIEKQFIFSDNFLDISRDIEAGTGNTSWPSMNGYQKMQSPQLLWQMCPGLSEHWVFPNPSILIDSSFC